MEEDKGLGDSPTNSGPTDMRHILVTDSTPNTKDDTTYTMYRKSKWDRCLELFIVMFTFVFLISIPLPFLDPTPLREIKDTLSHDSSDMERWEDDEILKGIREHCESLNRYILPIPLLDPFEDQDHEVRPPLIDINVYMERNKSGKFVGIPEEAIFTTYLGNPAPRSVLLSGGVGQGKSTYIKGIIRKWCKRQVTENTKKQMMVYLPGKLIITEEDLRNFHLEEKCPLCRLLARGYGGFNRNGEVMYRYTIPHKPFLDHWVARGILSLEKTIRKFFMMYISSEMEWSNSQLILCDLLARQTNKDKRTRVSDFVSMIRYMMIMLPGRCNMLWNQHFLAWTWSGSRLIKNINKNGPNFKDVLMDKVSRDGLFHLLMGLSRITTNDLIYEVDIIDAEIDRMFETNSVYMQDYAWFEAINLDSCSASHIYRCLKEILPEELDNVTQSTLGSLLPYKLNNDWTYYKRRLIPGWLEFPQIAWHYLLHPYYDKYRMRQNGTYFHIQGTPRWGVVETEGETHLIHIWTPIDGPSILQQISVADQQQPSTTNNENSLDNVVFHCDYNRQVFGSPPRSDYSHSSWGKLLKVALGIARDITVVLKNQTLTPSDQIVPILQALHPYSNISLHPEQVTVKYGFISLPDLVKWTDIHFYVQTCGTKVVLFKPIVFVKEVVPDECVWSSTIKAIHNSPFVTLPIWISVSAY